MQQARYSPPSMPRLHEEEIEREQLVQTLSIPLMMDR